jgi:uncharacterized repeat protein (TIGR01451 family)
LKPTATADVPDRESSRQGRREFTAATSRWERQDDGSARQPLPKRPTAEDTDRASAATLKPTGGSSGWDDPMLRPLHERLKSFRASALSRLGSSKPAEGSHPVVDSFVATPPAESTAVARRVDSQPKSSAATTHVSPTIRPDRSLRIGSIGRPVIVQKTVPSTPRREAPPAAAEERNLLFSRKSPVLSVETVGPRQIAVGKESVYEVTIQNRGEVSAENVVVYVNLPAWTQLVGAQPSSGATHAASPDQAVQRFQWQVGNLPPQSREKLQLKIVPRESRPFDLSVRWDYQPVASQAMIEVQEPKLVVDLNGPRDVLYGEKEVYILKFSNTGNGDAENLVIKLVPLGAGGNQPVLHNLGTVQAGQHKTIEVELTARRVGNLTIKVEVRGDGGLYAELTENVLVRRAALQVDVEGPKVQYVGGVAGYRISVRNPGTAAAKNVKFSVSLPPAAKYLSGIEGARLEANGTKLQWELKDLEPAGERTFGLNCRLDLPGSTQIDVVSTADGDLTASAGMTTRVEAMADLTLQVKDPTGPIPVGEETTYEVRVRNRGTKNAPNVQVIIYFSRGIEPLTAEGAPHKVGAGRVIFSPIPSLVAGEDLVLKVCARAEVAGNHIFRAEVHCQPLGTRLVSEDSTHFYQDESLSRRASSLPPAGNAPAPAAEMPQDAGLRKPTDVPVTAGAPTPAVPRR